MADDFEVPGCSYIDLELAVIDFVKDVIPQKCFIDFINGELSIAKVLEVYFSKEYDYAVQYVEDNEIPARHDAETDISKRIIYLRESDMSKDELKGRIIMSIYHEISHVVLGHTPYALLASEKVARGNNKKIPIYNSAEWQAEAGASAFAMPFPSVCMLIVHANKEQLPDYYIISELMKRFHVSYDAAAKRLSNVRKFIFGKGKGQWLFDKWKEIRRSLIC